MQEFYNLILEHKKVVYIEITRINSDFFWTLAGMGLVIQGVLERHRWRETKKNMLITDKFIFKGRKKC